MIAQRALKCLKDSAEQPAHTWADYYCAVPKLWRKSISLKGGEWKAGYFTVTSHDQQRWYCKRNTRLLITQVVKSKLCLSFPLPLEPCLLTTWKATTLEKSCSYSCPAITILTMMITLISHIPQGKYAALTKAPLRLFKTPLLFTARHLQHYPTLLNVNIELAWQPKKCTRSPSVNLLGENKWSCLYSF